MDINWRTGAYRVVAALFGAIAVAGPAVADPPTAPVGMFVRAEPTAATYRIRVTWADLSGETSYEVLRHGSPSPGPMLVTRSGVPALGDGWEVVGRPNQNASSFVHEALQAGSYAICGTASTGEISCFGPSGFAVPRLPEADATVDSLRVYLRAIDRLGVQWTSSANTLSAEVTLRLAGAVVETRTATNNAATAIFNGLQPNTSYEVLLCVRNARQTAQNATCRSLRTSTLPRVPGGVRSFRAVPSNVPTEAVFAVVHDNERESAVRGLQVNLIRDNTLIDSQSVRPDRFGAASHTVRFGNLTPFTDYEGWVVPFNESGIGLASGVSVTTVAAVNLVPEPISADSVLLNWSETAPGTYAIERLEGASWIEVASFRALQPGSRKVVLDRAGGGKTLRLTWRLASLAATSAAIAPEPLAEGSPELISSHRSYRAVGNTRQLRMRTAITFRTTRGGLGAYELERKTADGWRAVDESRILATIPDNTVRTIVDESLPPALQLMPQETIYRVCRIVRGRGAAQGRACSAESGVASFGVVRVE